MSAYDVGISDEVGITSSFWKRLEKNKAEAIQAAQELEAKAAHDARGAAGIIAAGLLGLGTLYYLGRKRGRYGNV